MTQISADTVSYGLDIAERRLPSGLTLIAARNPDVRTFAASVTLYADARVEGADQEGIGFLLGACLDEGTAKRSSVELAEASEALGAHLEGNPSGGSVQCPASEADKALRLLREIVLEPSFPTREVRRVQQELLVQIRNELADASVVAQRMFRKAVYGRHRYGRPAYGQPSRLEAFRPAELRRFHARWFVPERGAVVASGPFETDDMLDRLARVFRNFKGALPETAEQPAPPPRKARTASKRMPREQVHVYLGHLGVRRTHPDFVELMVMDNVLGSGAGFTSRISQRLRDEEGLCYSVHASITSNAGIEPGTFAAYIGTSPAHREAAIAGFREEIKRLQQQAPTREEVADAQSYLTGSYPFSLQRSSSLVRYAASCWRYGLGYDYADRRRQQLLAVTPDDVQRVAAENLDADRVTIASAGAA